jgi:8-oxo-dGTP pyrophosphatase MutT (NUDIX family)
MPSVIDPETLYVDDLPAIWSPVQWELTEEERIQAVEEQATASLLWTMDAPEAILRLLLEETGIQRLYGPPKDYNPQEQGDWDKDLITFGPVRPMKLESAERTPTRLEVVYDFGDRGRWELVIESERVNIERI